MALRGVTFRIFYLGIIIIIIIEVFIVSVIKINKIYCSLAQIGQSVCIFYFYLSQLCSVAFAYVG